LPTIGEPIAKTAKNSKPYHHFWLSNTGEKLRQLAATDAMNDTFKEKEAVLKELLTVCVNTNQQ
jgi:hypothetical protein